MGRGRRSLARETAMQMLFQMDAQTDFSPEAMEDYLRKYLEDASQRGFIVSIYEHVRDNLETIDAAIERSSDNWRTARMARVDLTILRIAAAEVMFMDNIPASVSANEAVDLAKIFGGDDSSKFVNGILGKLIGTR
ncbi:MAG: transcription antitermination factor NusB [Clostridiales Family XIII bacterium]|jgi:N utilization substance protein B|nr:transcription antitermination factor NusB [Clostridiales Family XIII bacterium]